MRAFSLVLVLLLSTFGCYVKASHNVSPLFVKSELVSGDSWVDAMNKAVAYLNQPVPGTWTSLMNNVATSGSTGHAQVGSGTYAAAMASWPIPTEFRSAAETNVGLLIVTASEGEYIGQSFVFSTKTGQGSLATLAVVARRDAKPTDPQNPISVGYYVFSSTCGVVQQYTQVTTRHCSRCAKCLWVKKCCCHNEVQNVARGDTPSELNAILLRLEQDQYNYYLTHRPSALGAFSVAIQSVQHSRASPSIASVISGDILTALKSFVQRLDVQLEVTANYSDSIITAFQNFSETLHSTTQSTRLAGVADMKFVQAMTMLSDAFGVLNQTQPFIETDRQQATFSHEIFLPSPLNPAALEYIWILGDRRADSSHDIFLASTMVDLELVGLNSSNTSSPFPLADVDVVRTSLIMPNGSISSCYYNNMSSIWPENTTQITMDILRYMAAQTLLSKNSFVPRMPSADNSVLPYFPADFPFDVLDSPKDLEGAGNALSFLTDAIKDVCSTWQDIANTFKTTESVSVQEVIRLGFNHFHEKSTVMHAGGIAQDKLMELVNMIIPAFNLPNDDQTRMVLFELEFAQNVTWDRDDFLYALPGTGTDKALTMIKTGDPVTGKADIFVVNVEADFTLAPDLLFVRKQLSVLGGIFSSDTTKIEDIPHVLSIHDAIILQEFFKIIALGKLAEVLGIPVNYPVINDTITSNFVDVYPLTVIDKVEDAQGILDGLTALTDAIKEVCSTWQDIAKTFKTTESVSVQQIIRLGFNYFHEKSTVMHAGGLPQDKMTDLVNMMIPAFNLPNDAQTKLVLFELNFAQNVTWDKDDFMYAVPGTGSDKALMMLKSVDPNTGLVDIFVVDVEAAFTLAPDLLLVRTQLSVLGGIFSSDKTKIQEIPHVLSLHDAIILQEFFKIIAMGKLAEVLGIPFSYPVIPSNSSSYYPLGLINKPEDVVGVVGDISSLTTAIQAVCAAWQAIANAFKTTVSVSVKEVIRLGFNYFHEVSSVLHAGGVSPGSMSQLVPMLISAYQLPNDDQTKLVLFELEFADNVTWDRDDFMYSVPGTGTDKAFLMMKSADPLTGLADIFVVNIEANYNLAPDLLVVRTQKSILGGIFSSDTTRIEEIPHVLSVNDAIQLQEFFKIIALGKLAEVLGIHVDYPVIPPI